MEVIVLLNICLVFWEKLSSLLTSLWRAIYELFELKHVIHWTEQNYLIKRDW